MNKKLISILLLISTGQLCADSDFEDFKQQHNLQASDYSAATEQEFKQYKKQLDAGFKALSQTYQQESRQYRQQMTSR